MPFKLTQNRKGVDKYTSEDYILLPTIEEYVDSELPNHARYYMLLKINSFKHNQVVYVYMKKQNKYWYGYVVQENYGYGGWDDTYFVDTRRG